MTTSQATIKRDWYSRMKRPVEKLRRRPLLGSLHTIRIFLKTDIFFFAVLAFRPHVTGVFGAPKTQVFENGPRSGVF